ncbi:MAG: 2-oxoglutarate dehydrogenase, partial [Ignavibacteriales bacterium]
MEVIMPKMGESVSEGTIIKWHKKVGDKVKRDEVIFEISTDKVDTEIPSPSDGVLKEIKVNEGDTVEVGTVVAIINENGEASEKSKPQQAEEATKEESRRENVEKVEAKIDNKET